MLSSCTALPTVVLNMQADIVVLATGYQNKEQQLLPLKLQPLAGYDQDGNQWLYR